MGDQFKVNEDFAKKYNKYRQKEELQRLKSKYGDVDSDESSDSESEDENAEGLTPALERGFFKALAYIKKKDPAIYDSSKTFYGEESEESDTSSNSESIKKHKPMFLKDYERKVVLENEGKFLEDLSDVENETQDTSPSYMEEQELLKAEFKKAITSADTENDDDLLVKRKKSSLEEKKEEEEFRRWLKTPEATLNLPDSQEVEEVKKTAEAVSSLKQYWCDPSLDDGEKFLRDYILDKKYLEKDDENPTYDEIVGFNDSNEAVDNSEDELFQKKSEIFEHKYNFRFQEPDQEFIKSYPRTIGDSVRRKDESRKKKREERKKKVEVRKKKKQEELKQLKLLKKKEIMGKIMQLQEATGNKDITFSEADLQAEFDPEKHDQRMQEVFDSYDNDFDEEKPVFSDLEDMEGCDNYWEEGEEYYGEGNADCEDPDFVMDCDYDPAEHQRQKEQRRKRKGKQPSSIVEKKVKSKKSAFYESVAKEKPVFDPSEKSFDNFLDEYYALDYEDLIGDLPCRFKYRQVVPNDFGLSTDEILGATDRELNTWCSLRRTVQHREEKDEIEDIKKYRRKGRNLWKKARVLKSVYETPSTSEEAHKSADDNKADVAPQSSSNVSARKRKRLKELEEKLKLLQNDEPSVSDTGTQNGRPTDSDDGNTRKSRKTKNQNRSDYEKVAKVSHDRLKAYGLQPTKYLNKLKYGSNKAKGL